MFGCFVVSRYFVLWEDPLWSFEFFFEFCTSVDSVLCTVCEKFEKFLGGRISSWKKEEERSLHQSWFGRIGRHSANQVIYVKYTLRYKKILCGNEFVNPA